MTSKEIANFRIARGDGCSYEADIASYLGNIAFMLKESAYQLAVFNEQKGYQAPTADESATTKAGEKETRSPDSVTPLPAGPEGPSPQR